MPTTQVDRLADARTAFETALTRQWDAEAEWERRKKKRVEPFLIQKARQEFEDAVRDVEEKRTQLKGRQQAATEAEKARTTLPGRYLAVLRRRVAKKQRVAELIEAIHAEQTEDAALAIEQVQLEAAWVDACWILDQRGRIPIADETPHDFLEGSLGSFGHFLKKLVEEISSGNFRLKPEIHVW